MAFTQLSNTTLTSRTVTAEWVGSRCLWTTNASNITKLMLRVL
ncbi:unnamed protein product [Medioppia subpectinata]|uniref:Uncharacterized protein n=1 Tax=Medioppia subpectinata TaxID=1979941 RepID=A0A7R9LW89_9ACAR|nr:unnamed protein product [Medioppia subpectinata]CAG2122017.1 unnamed protein product [Medioppia subpectinata]